MDLAYDALLTQQSRSSTPTPQKSTTDSTSSDEPPPTPKAPPPQRQNLQTEFQETFKAFSNTEWGAKLGGWWSSTQKQGQSYYEEAVKEAEDLRIDALKGFNDLKQGLVGRVRSMSLEGQERPQQEDTKQKEEEVESVEGGKDAPPTTVEDGETEKKQEDTETFLERFKAEAAKRLKEVQKAEDAADEALLRFGTNIRNFLKEAVSVTAPEDEQQGGEVLFESKDAATGKRTIHTNRLDAQLYVIHTNDEGMQREPEGDEWQMYKQTFDASKETERIAKDLEQYPELRTTMEKLVPEKVEYGEFWMRYYFLRRAVEAREEKRKEMLKASNDETEEVGWDDDEDDEDRKASTPQKPPMIKGLNDSSTTINQTSANGGGRRSHDEKSVADSEASYDIVSGAPSRAASSPKERKVEESDEEDWE